MDNRKLKPLSLAMLIGGAGLLLQACSSGSVGSDVGDQGSMAPTARAQILNGGTTGVFREGSEVILTGKSSEDGDGPVLDWLWQQTSGPAVTLVEVNPSTVSFTAPDVDESTTLTFELTAEDSSSDTGQASVDVTVVPAQDADKFLSLDVRSSSDENFDSFSVVAALADGADTGATPKPFTLSVKAYLVYPPRSSPDVDCTVDPIDFSAGIPSSTASGCLVELLEDLTPEPLPGGGTGIESAWPANVLVPAQDEQAHVDSWWNPRFTIDVPRLDVRDFNQFFVNFDLRERMLDQFAADRSRIALDLSLTAPENQSDAMLILTELSSAPIIFPSKPQPASAVTQKIVLNDGAGLPTREVVPQETLMAALSGRETALTSEVYYNTVDPQGTRLTFNDWLLQAGFATDENGTLHPDAVAGDGEFAHAVYLNNYDLGFGRDMYTRVDEFGNVYSFVTNYATLEGAIRKLDSIVTVVMEYSPLGHPSGADKFVKFFTYVDDGSGDSVRVTSMNFDGRGERFTPGNCIACHGGAKPPGVVDELIYDSACGDRTDAMCYTWPSINREGVDISNGDLRATFLPWDLESFLYADTDPAIVDAPVPFDGVTLAAELERDYGDFSRASQGLQLKKLNEAAYRTYCTGVDCTTDAARRLVEHWYGGVDADGNLIADTFDDSAAPEGWRNDELVPDPADPNATIANPADAEELYHGLYAQHCRMCHTNITEPSLRFDTYRKLVLATGLQSAVFDAGIMPAARLTMDRLWAPFDGSATPVALLAAHLGMDPDDATPPSPHADIDGNQALEVDRNETVRLSAETSQLAESFAWQLAYEPPPELVGSNAVLGYEPTLVGDGTPSIAFLTEKPGTYTAELVINDADPADAPEAFTDTQLVTVQNFEPVACDDSAATSPGGSDVNVMFLGNDRFAPSGSGSTCTTPGLIGLAAGHDLPVTYAFQAAFDQNGQFVTANGGTFTLVPGAECTVENPEGCTDDELSYTPSDSGDSYVETLAYSLTDVDGEPLGSMGANTATVTVDVTAALSVSEQAVADPLSEAGTTVAFSVSGGALALPGEERYRFRLDSIVRGSLERDGTPVLAGVEYATNGTLADLTMTYTSDPFETGLETIQITVFDSVNVSDSALFVFNVLPQATFTDVLNELQVERNCRDCHLVAPASDVFDLGATPASIYSQIVNGTGGGVVKVVAAAQRQTNPDDSIILCYPSSPNLTNNCPDPNVPTPSHDGGQALPPASASYAIIRRWIQEGALNN